MTKDDFARELLIGELEKEKGRFVTQRIIDRLVLLYSPLFEREYLTKIAEDINESQGDKNTTSSSIIQKPPGKKFRNDEENTDGGGLLASAVNQ